MLKSYHNASQQAKEHSVNSSEFNNILKKAARDAGTVETGPRFGSEFDTLAVSVYSNDKMFN